MALLTHYQTLLSSTVRVRSLYYRCSQMNTWRLHLLSVHEEKKPFECEICNKSFSKKGELTVHVDLFHEKNKCEICANSFANKNKLTRHVKSVHEKKKPFQCEICEKQFSKKNKLKGHIKSVHEEKKLQSKQI